MKRCEREVKVISAKLGGISTGILVTSVVLKFGNFLQVQARRNLGLFVLSLFVTCIGPVGWKSWGVERSGYAAGLEIL